MYGLYIYEILNTRMFVYFCGLIIVSEDKRFLFGFLKYK